MVKSVIFIIGILVMLNFIGVANAVTDFYLESNHPINSDHSNPMTYQRDWKIPMHGNEHIKLHVTRWSLNSDDRITILDNNGKVLSKNSNGANNEDGYWTPWFTSEDYITIHIMSKIGDAWGFSIDQIDTDIDTYIAETTPQPEENDDKYLKSNNPVYNQPTTSVNPQTTQEIVDYPPAGTVTKNADTSSEHKLTAAGARMVRTGRMQMPNDIQPKVVNPPTAIVTLYTQDTSTTVGHGILVSYTVSNKITKPVMHCDMILMPPSGVSVEGVKIEEGQGGQYRSVVDIEPGKSNTISAMLTPNNAGNFTVKGTAEWYYGNDKTSQEQSDVSTDIQAVPPVPTHTDTQETPEQTTTNKETSLLGMIVALGVFVLLVYAGILTVTKRAPWSQP